MQVSFERVNQIPPPRFPDVLTLRAENCGAGDLRIAAPRKLPLLVPHPTLVFSILLCGQLVPPIQTFEFNRAANPRRDLPIVWAEDPCD